MKSLLFLFALFCYTNLVAQKKGLVTVKAGENIMDVLPSSEVFYYPHFTNGQVFLRNGSKSEGKMNYNRLVDEMHFINPNGDTLALANENLIKYIAIGKDTFYYDAGYIRVLSAGNLVKLGVRQTWKITDTRQIGAYNSTNNSLGILSYTSVHNAGSIYDLIVNEDVILKKVERYYFGDNYYQFVTADKGNLLTLFPKEQQRISLYLKENKTNFNSLPDLEKLVQFLRHL